MRTRIIPAQITTVEDKIAGNISVTQLLILMIPVIFTTSVFILLPPHMQINAYKLVFSSIVLIVNLILAFRFKGKVIAHWLIILLRYNMRPRWYVLDKNESYLRTMHVPTLKKLHKHAAQSSKIQDAKPVVKDISFPGLVQLEQLIKDPAYTFSLKLKKRGGLQVALKQIS